MRIAGKEIASELLARAARRVQTLARVPTVALIVAGETPATASYLKAKERAAVEAGCRLEVIRLSAGASTVELRLAVDAAGADAVVVQLPVPPGASSKEVCDAIPLEKDADVLSSAARMRFEADEPGALIPPVALALATILDFSGVAPRAKRAVVLGDGWLVGRPAATWLAHVGADVVHIKNERGNLDELRLADIIVSGTGSPHLITPGMLKEGSILIDAGTSELGGRLAGDADPACEPHCALFTPVPGGVGPVAVAALFANVAALAEQATKR